MNALDLMSHLATERANAVRNRRQSLLTQAQERHVNANMYAQMGLYSVSARERIAAVEFETMARNLKAETVVIL